MGKRWIAVATVLVVSLATTVHAAGLDLTRYRVTSTIELPQAEAAEASAVTYNWDNGNLFVLGDEGDALVQYTRSGTLVNTMTLTGFADTEGLTYIGGGKFVITEERLRDAYLLTYAAGATVARASLRSLDLGSTVVNIGIEGISFEQASGKYFTVKEKDPQEVNQHTLDFAALTASSSPLFTPNLGVADLSDVQVLSGVTSLQGESAQNLLIFSQEAARLLEVTRSGVIVSQFDFSKYSETAEGLTIDPSGTIYIVAESALGGDTSTLFVLTPVPEPETYAMLLAGLAMLGIAQRRRNRGSSPVPFPIC